MMLDFFCHLIPPYLDVTHIDSVEVSLPIIPFYRARAVLLLGVVLGCFL
jgi:hypothetical protein